MKSDLLAITIAYTDEHELMWTATPIAGGHHLPAK